ncbi:MAG: HD domain-containing protein [Terrimonas sp.]|nr:HD domain-containing protein [Terrimonas sp.]
MHINQQMIDFVVDLLKDRIPDSYTYHDYKHTLYVLDNVKTIGREEHCTEKEIELLSVAALWHDTGYINTYKEHELESCRLAIQYLPGYGYQAEDIDLICGMIMATRVPQTPLNKLEEIITDADLEYLGTEAAGEKARLLFRELQSINPSLTQEKWNKTEIDFLQNHHYFTHYCKTTKEPVKQIYLASLL